MRRRTKVAAFFAWLIHSESGLLVRVCAGVSIFALLAGVDLRRHGSAATRWKEYAFLTAATMAAMTYGVINDQITSRISWEYFYYGKELEHALGPTVPPDVRLLHWEAAKVGLKATWSAGLIIGVALLLANNPRRDGSRLRYRELLPMLAIPLIFAALLGLLFGLLGSRGMLDHFSPDFEQMVQADLFRPRRFICVWGIHLGGYLGGAIGTIFAVFLILRRRFVIGSCGA